MERSARTIAKNAGLNSYYTGKPCKHGHVSRRRVHNKECVACKRNRLKKWRIKNKKRHNENNRNSYHQVGRTKAVYYKKWRTANPAKYKAIVRRRGVKAGAKGTHTADDIQILFKAQSGKCVGCRISLIKGYHVDHKTPLSRNGSNYPRNLQLLCQPCNDSKGTKTQAEWEEWRG